MSALAGVSVGGQRQTPAWQRQWQHFRYVTTANPVTLLAFIGLGVMIAVAILGPYLIPYDPLASLAEKALKPPSLEHWFGTDQLGRDVFSRVVVATRLDLLISVSAVALSFVVGAAIGAAAGYWGGWFDQLSGRLLDTIMAFPLFVLATAIINLPFYARVARAEVAIRRNAAYVQAARLSGSSDLRLLICTIFPNTLPPMMVQLSLNMGWAILNAAGLSFIGLGVRAPTAEWGIMVAEGANFIISGEWWLALFPGAALMLAVFTFNLLGDGLRDLVDPARRT